MCKVGIIKPILEKKRMFSYQFWLAVPICYRCVFVWIHIHMLFIGMGGIGGLQSLDSVSELWSKTKIYRKSFPFTCRAGGMEGIVASFYKEI